MSLRTRLTVWYGALLALTLLAFSALLYFTLQRSLLSNVDDTLIVRADSARRALGPNVTAFLQPEDVAPGAVDARPLDEFSAPGIYVQVLNARGSVVYAPPNLLGGELPIAPETIAGVQHAAPSLVDLQVPGGDAPIRVRTVPVLGTAGDVVGAVQVGQSLSPVQATMAEVARLLLSAGSLALLVAVAVGWMITRRALHPVTRITQTARHIAETGDYRQRLGVPHTGGSRGDELAFLATTFNAMIARLEQVLESQRRLLADTSHELRNPLTVIRGNLALLRRSGLPESMHLEAVSESDDEAARMGRLVNDLLLLARMDAGDAKLVDPVTVDLLELAVEVVDQVRPFAGSRAVSAEGEAVSVVGNRDRLKQLLTNLVENAVHYTPDGGTIRVSARFEPVQVNLQHPPADDRSSTGRNPGVARGSAVVTVADTGVGIPSDHLPHVFDRFYRADRARSRADGGTGLGLAIAQSVAASHGGFIAAASAGVNQGSIFTVRLPAADLAKPERLNDPRPAKPLIEKAAMKRTLRPRGAP